MRKLSDKFITDFINPEGILHPILNRLKKDHTLMLAIRDSFVNIYYRGGSIVNLKENIKGFYEANFNDQYNKNNSFILRSPKRICTQDDAKIWVESIPTRKSVMDEFFSEFCKSEREFQQLIARENNNSTISSESEYFISDIEFAESFARFDIVAIRWLFSQRKNGGNCKPALIEMKYGDGALDGSAGLLKHLKDMDSIFSSPEKTKYLYETMEVQFNQLDQLGLLKFNKGTSNTKVRINPDEKPEVVFILANHNPRSKKLLRILGDPELDRYADSKLFDLKFFVACFAGYGLHQNCLVSLPEFREMLFVLRDKKIKN